MDLMKIYKDNTDDDRTSELETLFDIYQFDEHLQYLFLKKIEEVGIDAVIEDVLLNLPDGFSCGHYKNKDLIKRLKFLDDDENA